MCIIAQLLKALRKDSIIYDGFFLVNNRCFAKIVLDLQLQHDTIVILYHCLKFSLDSIYLEYPRGSRP